VNSRSIYQKIYHSLNSHWMSDFEANKRTIIKFQNYVNALANFIERKDIPNAKQLLQVLQTGQVEFQNALKGLNMDPDKYKEALINIYSLMTIADQENATNYCEDAFQLDHSNTVVLNNLAYIYHKKDGNVEKSFQTYLKCLKVDPKYMPAYMGLCDLLHQTKAFEIEINILKTGLANFPESCDLWNQFGVTLCHSHLFGSVQEPLHALQKALTCAKSNVERAKVLVNLGHLACSLGEVRQSLELYILAIQNDPTVRIAYQNLLLNIHYVSPDDTETEALFRELSPINLIGPQGIKSEYYNNWITAHQNYASVMYAKTLYENSKMFSTPKTFSHDILRIGYLSSDFVGHVVGMFISGFFKHHDRSRFSVYAYSNVQLNDSQSKSIPCDHYRDISGLDTRQAMIQIQKDEIDILIDLGGYTSMNRVDVMAFPVVKRMYTFLGYPNGLGMPHVKRISDSFTELKSPGIHSDALIIPRSFLNFDPIVPMNRELLINDRPQKGVVFACYAKLAKITPHMTKLWTSIIKGVPLSRLLIKSRFFSDKQFARSWFHKHFPPELFGRVSLFTGGKGYLEHIHKFNYVDIHLDTFPYSGTTITTEALFYGVPSLTLCPSDAPHVSRVTGSIMKQVGLDEYICLSDEQYVSQGIKLGSNFLSGKGVLNLFRESSVFKPQDLVKDFENSLLQDFTTDT
jgi:predicted O-linked N-acetylglucosamine transferase (SPINDLY family)